MLRLVSQSVVKYAEILLMNILTDPSIKSYVHMIESNGILNFSL